MNDAEKIKHDYRGHLGVMFEKAKEGAVKILTVDDRELGGLDYCMCIFKDSSALEFNTRHSFAYEVLLYEPLLIDDEEQTK